MSSRDDQNTIASLVQSLQKVTGDRACLRLELRNAHKGIKKLRRKLHARDDEIALLWIFAQEHQQFNEYLRWREEIRVYTREMNAKRFLDASIAGSGVVESETYAVPVFGEDEVESFE